MSLFFSILATLGSLVTLRALLLALSAETGRKQDLIKHIYKSGIDFHIAVVIPFLDPKHSASFSELLTALSQQDYPSSNLGIHVVVSKESAFGLPPEEDLPENVRVWHYPAKSVTRGPALAWLVERLLALGGASRLFVFLDANDIIRSDYMKNVTTRAFDCFAMQGYIALKRPPQGLVSAVSSLSTRLINRIENAGRFHMGLSSRLMQSGWIVRQEVLEMLPFKQGMDTDNLEYTAQLNLNGYRVHWAPNVVVYKDDVVSLSGLVKQSAHASINRLRLALRYSIPLLLQGFTRMKINAFEQAWGLIKPPNFILGLLFILSWAVGYVTHAPLIQQKWGTGLMVAFLGVQLLNLLVARCRMKDVVSSVFVTPLVYLMGVILYPFMLVVAVFESLGQLLFPEKPARIGKRFDEALPSVQAPEPVELPELTPNPEPMTFTSEALEEEIEPDDLEEEEPIIEKNAPPPGSIEPRTFAEIYEDELEEEPEPEPEPVKAAPIVSHRSVTVLIGNGTKSLECLLHFYAEVSAGNPVNYYLVCEYKTLSVKTQVYTNLEDAYQELQDKLAAKGLEFAPETTDLIRAR